MALQEYENIKGFTYVSGIEPLNPDTHDTWFNTSNDKVYMYDNHKWTIYSNARFFIGSDYGFMFDGSEIERIHFPFDSGTTTHVGNLTQVVLNNSACNSSNYGYSCCGTIGSMISNIDRITFPFDSGSSIHIGNLSETRAYTSSCNSSNYGYICGGTNGAFSAHSAINRIRFPFDSGTASHIGNLSGSVRNSISCNSSNYGYNCGGVVFTGDTSLANHSTIDRITFPFDSGTTSHVGNMAVATYANSSCNSSNYGFICGGAAGYNAPNKYSTIERISFPFNSGTSSHVGNISETRYYTASCNSSNYGYICGGLGGLNYSNVERITFPFDSGTSTHIGSLSENRSIFVATDGTDFTMLFN